jgi:hypothetical protein
VALVGSGPHEDGGAEFLGGGGLGINGDGFVDGFEGGSVVAEGGLCLGERRDGCGVGPLQLSRCVDIFLKIGAGFLVGGPLLDLGGEALKILSDLHFAFQGEGLGKIGFGLQSFLEILRGLLFMAERELGFREGHGILWIAGGAGGDLLDLMFKGLSGLRVGGIGQKLIGGFFDGEHAILVLDRGNGRVADHCNGENEKAEQRDEAALMHELVEESKNQHDEKDDAQEEKDDFAWIETFGETAQESHESSRWKVQALAQQANAESIALYRSGVMGWRNVTRRDASGARLVELASGEIEGGLGAGVVGELSEKAAVGLLSVGVAAGLELGLAEGVLRSGRLGVEGDSLLELRDREVVLLQSKVGVTEAEVVAGIRWMLGDQSAVEGDGLIEFSEVQIGAAEMLLINGVAGFGRAGFLPGGNGFGIPALLKIERPEH